MTLLEKATSDASGEAAKTANNLLSRILGPAADEWGLIISDTLKPRRLKNQIRNFKKVQDIIEKEGIEMKQVNLKVLFPYLENVSLEEDETLQNIWAKLFTNYIDAAKNLNVTVYPNVLSQLSTEDIELLSFMADDLKLLDLSKNNQYPHNISTETIINLERLSLIEELDRYSAMGWPSENESYDSSLTVERESSNKYWITEFGLGLINACTR